VPFSKYVVDPEQIEAMRAAFHRFCDVLTGSPAQSRQKNRFGARPRCWYSWAVLPSRPPSERHFFAHGILRNVFADIIRTQEISPVKRPDGAEKINGRLRDKRASPSADCCARAATGHAAALPNPAMNCRRRILNSLALTGGSLPRGQSKGNQPRLRKQLGAQPRELLVSNRS
jgi:hypothetical protein